MEFAVHLKRISTLPPLPSPFAVHLLVSFLLLLSRLGLPSPLSLSDRSLPSLSLRLPGLSPLDLCSQSLPLLSLSLLHNLMSPGSGQPVEGMSPVTCPSSCVSVLVWRLHCLEETGGIRELSHGRSARGARLLSLPPV